MCVCTVITIVPPGTPAELAWLRSLWHAEWGGDVMVSGGHAYHLADLHAVVARKRDGELVGAP